MANPSGHSKAPLLARIIGGVPNVLRYLSLAFYAYVAILVGFFANQVSYSFPAEVTRDSVPYLMLFGIGFGCVLTVLGWFAQKRGALSWLEQGNRFSLAILGGVCVLIVVQIWIYHGLQFQIGQDIATVTDIEGQSGYGDYFSYYPHNLFVSGFLTILSGIVAPLGVDPYPFFVGVTGAVVAISVGLAALALRMLVGVVPAMMAFLVGAFWLGCSPTALTPYTDALGMLCPTVVFFAYVCIKNGLVKWGFIGFASVLGYYLKAFSLAALAAIVVVEVCSRLKRLLVQRRQVASWESRGKGRWVAVGQRLCACVLCGLVAFGMAQGVRCLPDVEIDPQKEMGVTHYLMLGVSQRGGVYDQDYFDYSAEFATKESRAEGNLQQWKSRMDRIWPDHVGLLLTKKTLSSFDDGSFRWRGNVIKALKGDNEALLIFYGLKGISRHVDAEGLNDYDTYELDHSNPWDYLVQVIWDAVLVGCVLSALRRHVSKGEQVLGIALLLLGAYLMIFEAGAHYPFVLTPFFLMLGTLGWCRLSSVISRLKEPSKGRVDC